MRAEEGWPQQDTDGTRPICKRHAHRRRLSSERTGPTCGGPGRRTAGVRACEDAGRHRCPARAGEAGSGQGTGQGESAVRSGDGCAWAADTLSQRCERGSDTHARSRTKRTGEQTHRHTQQWAQPDRHRETRGSIWAALVACLSVEDWSETVECSTRGCKVGVGGRPLRSVQRETAGCPELPDASRRDACEVIEGLRVCAWWDMWGGYLLPSEAGWGPRGARSKGR